MKVNRSSSIGNDPLSLEDGTASAAHSNSALRMVPGLFPDYAESIKRRMRMAASDGEKIRHISPFGIVAAMPNAA
jgi:hypothetical protein